MTISSNYATSSQHVTGTCSGAIGMVFAALVVAIASPATVGCCNGSSSARSVFDVLSHIFSPAFLSRHNVSALLSFLAAAAIETSTDALDNLVGFSFCDAQQTFA